MAQPSEQMERMQPLGRERLRIFSCLGGDMRHLPQYLELRPDEDVWAAFRSFVSRLVDASQAESDPLTRSLLATGRLLIGDLSGADEILDNLPSAPFRRDHGMGHCLVAPVETLSVVLPLPAAMRASKPWLAGSAEQAALKAWLAENRDKLEWREREGDYILD